jgi:hypothetical protein
MSFRRICEIVEAGGKTPVSEWIKKELDRNEQGRLHVRFARIEIEEIVNPTWLVSYTSLKMMEIRFGVNNRAIRFLCDQQGSDLIMLLAAQKNGNITTQEEERALRRRAQIEQGTASVRKYPNPQSR